jgi:hypothetical protein
MRPFALLALPLLAACSFGGGEDEGAKPTGSGAVRTYQLSGFEEVKAAGSDDVAIRVGPAFSVRAEGPPEVLDRLRVAVDDGALEIGRKRSMGSGSGSAKLFVTLPRLSRVASAGSGDVSVDRAEGDALRAQVAGSGGMMLSGLRLRDVDLDVAGSGTITAAGTADRLRVKMAGSGDVDARQLQASRGDVSMAGSGTVRGRVNGRAEVKILGSGTVDLGPDARCEVRKMGSGTVTCGR